MVSKLKKYEKCKNMLGDLPQEIIDRLEAFFDNPSTETWGDVFCIIIGANGFTTFWQSVLAVNPEFPRSAKSDDEGNTVFTTYPDEFTARRALKYATEGK